MLEAIIITVLIIVALDQHNAAKHYKERYEQMKRFYNDVADDNCRLRIKYGLSPTFSHNTMEDDIYDI